MVPGGGDGPDLVDVDLRLPLVKGDESFVPLGMGTVETPCQAR